MNRLFRWLGALMLLVGLGISTSHSAGVTDLMDLCTGANQSNCPFKVDANGNITSTGSSNSFAALSTTGNSTITGRATISGVTVFTPQSLVAVATTTTITPTATYIQLLSTANFVTLGGGLIPSIATTTATNGQFLILSSTSTTSYVNISTGATSCVVGSTPTLTTNNRSVSFVFELATGLWKQIQQ